MKTDHESPGAKAVQCPRCGYDQAGEIARWDLECPVRGRCTECGLEFAWADVLNPDRGRLLGLVEHANTAWRCVRWTWTTWRKTLLPWRFWAWVQMHHVVRRRMLVLWLLLIVGVPHVVAGAIGLATVWTSVAPRTGWAYYVEPFVQPLFRVWRSPRGGFYFVPDVGMWPKWAWWLVVGIFAIPLGLGLLPISMRRASVRWSHVWRATVYSASVPAFYFVLEIAYNGLTLASWLWYSSAFQVSTTINTMIQVMGDAFGWFGGFAIVWLAVWWLFVLQRGWKLRHGWAVWLSLVVMAAAFLIAFGGVTITMGGRIYRF